MKIPLPSLTITRLPNDPRSVEEPAPTLRRVRLVRTPPEVITTLLLIGIALSPPLKPTFSVPALHIDPIPVTMTVLLTDPLPISALSEPCGENSEPPLVTTR